MRVLHVVKTSEGASWAALQAQVLKDLGIDVHVALPSPVGETVKCWRAAGATVHVADLALPVRHPWLMPARCQLIRRLVEETRPDVIHSHFVATTMMLRFALGPRHRIPRVFQVPGPLHLEHSLFARAEVALAGELDHWIASSQYIRQLYLMRGVSPDRIHLSYYGTCTNNLGVHPAGGLRRKVGIPPDLKVVGNINFMYPPKRFLGQTSGLKRHEDVIDALAIVCRKRPDVIGVIVGGQWGKGTSYERRLRRRATRLAGARIVFTGRIPQGSSAYLWTDFDCAVHVPISENCGGVVEPLASAVPTIASKVGGLSEVVIDGVTGWLVPPKNPAQLSETILEVLNSPEEATRRARLGRELVRTMFDVNRTAREVAQVYESIIDSRSTPPPPFDSTAFIRHMVGNAVTSSGSRTEKVDA